MDQPQAGALPELPPPPPPSPGPEGRGGAPRRRRRLVWGALAVVLAVAAGSAVLATLERGPSAGARALRLSFTPGERATYRIHMTLDGTVSAGELLAETPMAMDLTEVVTWEVTDVDEEGVATITVTVNEMSGSVNGVDLPPDPSALRSLEMRVAPDGRVLEAGGLSFAGADLSGGATFPGMGQMTPLLPDHPVEPGDTWRTSFSQDVPFGRGTISYEAESTFERYDELDGVRAAVITSRMTVPMDLTIRFDDLLGMTEGAGGSPTDAGALEGAEVAYTGKGSFTQRSWVDLEAREPLKVASTGTFDMTMRIDGLETFEGREIRFVGDFTMDLERASAGSDYPSEAGV